MVEMVSSGAAPTPVSSRVLRYVLIAVGSLAVMVGVVGVFVPLLPTTIFLLIGAACYGKSSRTAYNWLTTNRFFGKYLRDYQEERGATVLSKVVSIGGLWLGIGAAIYFLSLPIWVTIGLLVIAAGVTVHLLRLRTVR
jgi:uncharacterized protein